MMQNQQIKALAASKFAENLKAMADMDSSPEGWSPDTKSNSISPKKRLEHAVIESS